MKLVTIPNPAYESAPIGLTIAIPQQGRVVETEWRWADVSDAIEDGVRIDRGFPPEKAVPRFIEVPCT